MEAPRTKPFGPARIIALALISLRAWRLGRRDEDPLGIEAAPRIP